MEVAETNILNVPATPAVQPVIECAHLNKSFGDHVVLDDFNLVVNHTENVVVMGRSGIGKTVLIKCIIGLIKPDSGIVKVFGKSIPDLARKELNEIRKRIGFVFQSSALFDSLTYVYNIAYSGLRQAGPLAVTNQTFAGQYLAPVLRYMPIAGLTLDAGVFAGLPVADTQHFHTAQPILAGKVTGGRGLPVMGNSVFSVSLRRPQGLRFSWRACPIRGGGALSCADVASTFLPAAACGRVE